jgi:CBS domain-containing protein
MKIRDIMDTSPDIIRTSDTFEHLIKILGEVKYHVVFVVDKEEKLVGIVTEGDIIKVLVPKYVTVDESLISVMDVNYFERSGSLEGVGINKRSERSVSDLHISITGAARRFSLILS